MALLPGTAATIGLGMIGKLDPRCMFVAILRTPDAISLGVPKKRRGCPTCGHEVLA